MPATDTDRAAPPPETGEARGWAGGAMRRWAQSKELLGYASAVCFGAVLIVVAAYNQPYNQNELLQMAPYRTDDIDKIIHATRQPPLDPLVGALVQHVVGVGQLRQRLVPATAGILALVLMSLILRRLRTGTAGVVAVWAMACTPLLVRYSAYTRPYAVPLMLMLAYVFAQLTFEETRRKRWLVLLAVVAAALPATRVPEPNVFLGVTLLVTTWRGWRRQLARSVATPLVAIPLLAIVAVGYPLFRTLEGQSENIFDPSPSGVIDRFPDGVHEIFTGFLPLLSQYLPWWPLLLVAVALVVAIPQSRRRLSGWWFFWPLLAAPVVFALAYHFLNPFPFDVRPYRIRMAIFFVPPLVLMIAALTEVVTDASPRVTTRARIAVGGLVAALVVTQLPSTARVLTQNEAPDFQQAANVLRNDIPRNSIVLYDTVSPLGRWHQPFSGSRRYLGERPFVDEVETLLKHPRKVPVRGPVYVLMLDSECAYSVVCDIPPAPWDGTVPGWHVTRRFDRFTLYASDEARTGKAAAIMALEDFADALGPAYGSNETFLAARMLKREGRVRRAKAIIAKMYAEASEHQAERIRTNAEHQDKDPFG